MAHRLSDLTIDIGEKLLKCNKYDIKLMNFDIKSYCLATLNFNRK